MFYIHQAYCISPQQTFLNVDWNVLHESKNNRLYAIEPEYKNISRNILRRMGKSIRMGIGAASPILETINKIDGIIIGTATAGKDDSFDFLKQVMDYDEGLLSPTSFVQSTANAIASQIGLISNNKNYNITHVQDGFSFENAILDAEMLLQDNSDNNYLLGAVDELSEFDFNLNYLADCYKKEIISNKDLYNTNSPGTFAGEGSAMFLVDNEKENAIAKIGGIKTFYTEDKNELESEIKNFIQENNLNNKIDLLITGENGDNRNIKYYDAVEDNFKNISVTRFKHLCGEYSTASAFALWLACGILENQFVPSTIYKYNSGKKLFDKIVIYNNYKDNQHSLMLVTK